MDEQSNPLYFVEVQVGFKILHGYHMCTGHVVFHMQGRKRLWPMTFHFFALISWQLLLGAFQSFWPRSFWQES